MVDMTSTSASSLATRCPALRCHFDRARNPGVPFQLANLVCMHAPGHPPPCSAYQAHNKCKPNSGPVQTKCKPNPSPMQTKCKPNEPSCKSTANQVQTKRTILQINCKPSACATVRLEGVQDAHPYQS